MSSEVSTIVDRKDLVDKLNSVPCTEYYSFIMVEASKEIVKLEAERDALQKMLNIAWDAVQEAGYEDFAHELRAFMEGQE